MRNAVDEKEGGCLSGYSEAVGKIYGQKTK